MRASTKVVLVAVVFAVVDASTASQTAFAAGRRRGAKPAAAAAEPESGPSADTKEKARAAYGRGQTAFAAGQYAESKAAFQEAFDAVPNPIVLLGIAESQVKLGEVADAIVSFQKYLELRIAAPDRAEIETKIQALSAIPAIVTLSSTPSEADIDLDGMPTQKTTPNKLEVEPGKHTLDFHLKGYRAVSEEIEVKPGEKRELELTLESNAPALAAAAPSPIDDAAAEPASSGLPTTALWITGGVGAAGLIAGSVFGYLAVQEHSNFNDHPTKASADKGERLALFSDVGFGVAVLAIATGAVLFFTSDDDASSSTSDTAKLRLVPELTPKSIAASAQLQF